MRRKHIIILAIALTVIFPVQVLGFVFTIFLHVLYFFIRFLSLDKTSYLPTSIRNNAQLIYEDRKSIFLDNCAAQVSIFRLDKSISGKISKFGIDYLDKDPILNASRGAIWQKIPTGTKIYSDGTYAKREFRSFKAFSCSRLPEEFSERIHAEIKTGNAYLIGSRVAIIILPRVFLAIHVDT